MGGSHAQLMVSDVPGTRKYALGQRIGEEAVHKLQKLRIQRKVARYGSA
jgi:hypothetical protein